MAILHMESDEVRCAADQFYHLTTEIDENLGRLQRTLAQLESAWRGPSANHFSGELNNTLKQAHVLSADGATLARRLSAEVTEWEQAAASLYRSINIEPPIGFPKPIIPHFPFPFPPPPHFFPWPFPGMVFLPFRPGITPGGFWRGDVWEANDPTMPLIDTVYNPIRGYQTELMVRYREGEMTWDEMVGHLEDIEKSTRPDYFDGKVTLLDLGEAGGQASVGWKENRIEGKYGTFDASVGRAAVDGQASLRYGEDGLEANLGGTAGLYAIHGEASGQVAGVDMAGQAYLGAEVTSDVEAKLDPLARTVIVGAGVNAFVGAKAEGAVNKKIAKGVDVGTKGALMAGAGIIFEGEAGFEDNVLKIDYDLGAAWGIGAEVGFEVELNVIEAGQEIARIGHDAIYSFF